MFEKIVKNCSIYLHIENFGNSNNPAVILISGAGASARFWTDEFCNKLVGSGYFVIRFDHRDQGLSSAVDYEKYPYTVMDIAADVISILDKTSKKHHFDVGWDCW